MRVLYVYILLILLLQPNVINAQRTNLIFIENDRKTADSLRALLPRLKDQKQKVLVYRQLCWNYKATYLDTAIYYADKGIEIAEKINFQKGIADITRFKAMALWNFMHYNEAFDLNDDALALSKKN